MPHGDTVKRSSSEDRGSRSRQNLWNLQPQETKAKHKYWSCQRQWTPFWNKNLAVFTFFIYKFELAGNNKQSAFKIIYSTFHTFSITFNFEKTNKAVIIAAVWMTSGTPASTHPITFTLSCREHHGLFKKWQSFRNIVSQQKPRVQSMHPSTLNPRTYKQIHTPPRYKEGGGWGGGPPLGFRYVTIFWKDFTLSRKRSMCNARRGTYYGLPRCWEPVTSFKMATILGATLDFTEN